MAYQVINPRSAVAQIMVDGADRTKSIQRARVRSTLPQTDITTFSTEQNGAFMGGIERLTIDLIGIMDKGDVNTGPLMPLSNFQGVAVEVSYDTGCSISATCNGQDAGADRAAGAPGNVDGQFVSTDTIVVAWDDAAAT